jgi:hypothetical protein
MAGGKRKRAANFPPPADLGPFQTHPVHTDYVGWSDGRILSTKSGKSVTQIH